MPDACTLEAPSASSPATFVPVATSKEEASSSRPSPSRTHSPAAESDHHHLEVDSLADSEPSHVQSPPLDHETQHHHGKADMDNMTSCNFPSEFKLPLCPDGEEQGDHEDHESMSQDSNCCDNEAEASADRVAAAVARERAPPLPSMPPLLRPMIAAVKQYCDIRDHQLILAHNSKSEKSQ